MTVKRQGSAPVAREACSEEERTCRKERALSGKLRRAQEGRNPGFRPPYGYQVDVGGGVFAVEPVEAVVVRQIYDLYRDGSGALAITYRLNQEGVQFRGGRSWSVSTVKKILENPLYCGDLQYGRLSRNPNWGKQEGESFYRHHEPQVVSRDAVPAIVPRAEWDAVQAIRASRPGVGGGASGRAVSSRHLLSGIARCLCGCTIIGYRGRGETEFYYRCSGQRRKGRQSCDCGYVRQEVVDEIVLRKVEEDLAGRSPFDPERALQLQQLRQMPVAQQKQLLRDLVESVRIFRKQGTQELVCDIHWKKEK